MADRFFKEKATGDDATKKALEAHRQSLEANQQAMGSLAEGLRADLGQVTAASGGLERQLTELERQLKEIDKHLSGARADALSAKLASERMDTRLGEMEARQRQLAVLVWVILALLATILVALLLPFVRGGRAL